ncbi:MAG: AbrB/MazE/SpoVT family DNA-binding domain-containing protein [Planctomycetaceae bacterium]|nr:AbrB/MazE/SpoVT family DNA-binding domain-containing protein [Planctomycetaceae bacterium]
MVTKVQSWGNSQGLRLSKQVLAEASVTVGDTVDVTVRDGAIVITPVRPPRGKISLRSLVAQIPKGYRPKEADWGPRVGREAW